MTRKTRACIFPSIKIQTLLIVSMYYLAEKLKKITTVVLQVVTLWSYPLILAIRPSAVPTSSWNPEYECTTFQNAV